MDKERKKAGKGVLRPNAGHTQHRTVLIIFPLNLQTIMTVLTLMLSVAWDGRRPQSWNITHWPHTFFTYHCTTDGRSTTPFTPGL